MSNAIKPIPSKARELLEAVVSEFGIEVIEDYIKIYKKRQRKRMKKYNTKEEIAYEVYKLMHQEGYSRIRAIEKVAIEKNISENTVNNHLNNFNQEAKKNNFYTLGWIVDKIYEYWRKSGILNFDEVTEDNIDLLAKENELERDVLDAYYWKYKTLTKREKAKYKVNLNIVRIPRFFKENVLKEYYPQKTTQEIKNNNIQLNDDDDTLPF